ncbi:MAG: thioredoxin-disulfide reductase [Verrucomicrobia bacterium]|nr:thioredoxin-disulfide reductase [Verrucomicrobiota bacterium]
MHDVVIIGSGCAGLTAAIYTARANLKPVVLSGRMPLGLLTTTTVVENFPGFPEGIDGIELMQRLQGQAERFGATIEYGAVDQVDLSASPFQLSVDGKPMEARSLIIASGAGHRKLGLENEVRLENKGVTYCATCDGALPIFRQKPLVVVGGGDSACEEASYLTRFGSIVHLVHRRGELRASRIMAERVLNNPKIQMIWNSEVVDIHGDGLVTGVKLRNNQDDSEKDLECAGVFIAVGHVPNTQVFQGQIQMDDHGYVKMVQGSQTSVPGVFVAGDCADSVYRQAITAAGMGCAAAIDCERYLASLG